MSASIKKKLRKEQEAVTLTEKQLKEKAEAKKLKTYTITFVVIMALVLCIAVGTVAYTSIAKTGIFRRSIVAATVGEHKLSAADLNYYYFDNISTNYAQWQNDYGDYTQMMVRLMYGLDITAPLSYQTYNEENNTTWADYFTELALSSARTTYALYDKAIAEGFTLSEEEQATINEDMQLFQDYADLFYKGDADAYIETLYGTGATLDSFREYSTVRAVANAYQSQYMDSLTYDDATVEAYNQENYTAYNSFTFADKYINYSLFLGEGTKDEEGNVTHSDDEIAAAQAKAKEVSESLLGATSVEEFDEMIAKLDIYANDSEATAQSVASEKIVDARLPAINEQLRAWVSDPARKAGDMVVIENNVTTTDDDGNETTVLAGYFTLFFQGCSENLEPLANVRHLLVAFEGGTKDATTGVTTYSDSEKKAALDAANALLETWKKGDATEESFIALVKENTDDTASAENGGLYTDITPESNYVPNFLAWAVDPNREAGETGVIETEFGYHVLYYVGDSDITYREYLIKEDLASKDFSAWRTALIDAVSATLGNTGFIPKDYIIYSEASY